MQVQSPSFIPAPANAPELTDDQLLLVRSAQGDGEAFNALFHRHRDGLQGFLYRRLRSHDDAEDALTLTFCNAWRARQSFRGTSSGKAWLYQIATRVALDMLRTRRRRAVEQELDLQPSDRIPTDEEVMLDPLSVVEREEHLVGTRTAVALAMERLPADERQLVTMFYFDGHNYEQISDLLGISRSQVRGRLHRIRARMRRDLVNRQRWVA
jgi:RNA polymerase sigma-70 factor (ECF subfamily)